MTPALPACGSHSRSPSPSPLPLTLPVFRSKKEHTERLQRELSDLREENAALQMLLGEMASTGEPRAGGASLSGLHLSGSA